MNKVCIVGLLFLGQMAGVLHGAIFLGPIPYHSKTNSPFYRSISGETTYLEDFEDNAFNTPGATASVGMILAPGTYTDSVDHDDGNLSNNGQAGHSFYVAAVQGPVTFRFNSQVLSGFPKHAGIVWTDGNENATVTFEAFGSTSNSLGSVVATLGDDSIRGTAAEDRFFGVIDHGGISAIKVTISGGIPQEGGSGGGLELDHLQYSRGTYSQTNTSPVVLSIEPGVQVRWPSESGVRYQLFGTSQLGSNGWSAIGFPVTGNGTTNLIPDPVQSGSQRFYRLLTLP